MKKYLFILCTFFALSGLAGFISRTVQIAKKARIVSEKTAVQTLHKHKELSVAEPSASEQEQVLENIAKLPLMFEKNMGQWRSDVLYRATSQIAKVGFRKNGLSFYAFREVEEEEEDDPEEEEDDHEELEVYESMVWNLSFKNMNTTVQVSAQGEVAGVSSYLTGSDSAKWVKNAPQSRLIQYKEIYNHIDLHYYGLENSRLEYDYILKPGAQIADIQMTLDGIESLQINHDGELLITTPWGIVAEDKPFSYQTINGVKKQIDIRYTITGQKTFGFEAFGPYDTRYDLTIDPKQLVWSTFTKGNGLTHYTQDMAIDGNRNSYMTGWTDSNFDITPGVKQTVFGGGATPLDAFVCKFNRTGTQLIYCTYLGGSGDERGLGIAVNVAGNAYVTGRTESNAPSDFPTQSAIFPASQGSIDTYIAALNLTGTGFIYSTYFGCGSSDMGQAITVNGANEVYVTGKGKKNSTTPFPTTAGVVRTNGSADGSVDAYVVKLTATGTIAFCTLLGGSGADQGNGIFVAASGEIYVTGDTDGGFPMVSSYDNTANGLLDAFAVKLNATATAITYSTYLGGSGDDGGYGIYVRNGEAYVAGVASAGFPTTAGAYRTTHTAGGALGYDAFVTKLNTNGNGLVYSTFLGGSGDEGGETLDYKGSDVVVNNNGEAYVSGITSSPDFPVLNGYDMSYGGSGNDDGFITLLTADGSGILCSTYFGAEKDDYKRLSIALDLSGTQDTLYGSITSHSNTSADLSPGTFPISQTQGTVYNKLHLNNGNDQVAVFKMYSCMVPIVLPVQLIAFTGKQQGAYNQIEWATASETNSESFSLERSSDGVQFQTVTVMAAAGNSATLSTYAYADVQNGEDLVYYRLKQTDHNGTFRYSTVISVNTPESNKALQLLVAGAVTDELHYHVCCLLQGTAVVEVLDVSGQRILQRTVAVAEGYNRLTLDVKGISEGLYILKLTGDNGAVTTKFVK